MFYHQRTNIHDFIPIFVFVSDFVNKDVTSISYQISCLLGTFCVPNLQIQNCNQLWYTTGIVGTCLGHICYPQTLKRESYPYILVKLLLNSKRRIFWKFSMNIFRAFLHKLKVPPKNLENKVSFKKKKEKLAKICFFQNIITSSKIVVKP